MAGCQRDGWMQISFPGLKNETKIKHKLVVGMLQNPGEWWLHPGFHVLNNQFTTHDQKSSNTTLRLSIIKNINKKKHLSRILQKAYIINLPETTITPLQIGHSKKTIPSSNHEKTLLPAKMNPTQPRTPKQKTHRPDHQRSYAPPADFVVGFGWFFWEGISLIQGETFAPGPLVSKNLYQIFWKSKQKRWKMKVFHWVDDFLSIGNLNHPKSGDNSSNSRFDYQGLKKSGYAKFTKITR